VVDGSCPKKDKNPKITCGEMAPKLCLHHLVNGNHRGLRLLVTIDQLSQKIMLIIGCTLIRDVHCTQFA